MDAIAASFIRTIIAPYLQHAGTGNMLSKCIIATPWLCICAIIAIDKGASLETKIIYHIIFGTPIIFEYFISDIEL